MAMTEITDEMVEEAKMMAIEVIVSSFMDEARAEGLSLFEAICALYESAFTAGHESGHQCAELQASAHNHDTEDVRASAGYL